MLNRALFARHGVEVVGAIVNKVDADAHPTLPDILRDGLAQHGIELLGTLPYRPLLSNPTLSMLVEQVKGEVLSEGDDPDRVIEHVAIGAMQPRHLIERVGPGSLLIVPGDRTDVIQAIVAANRAARRSAGARRGLFARRQQVFGRPPDEPGSHRAGRPRPHWRLSAAAARPRGHAAASSSSRSSSTRTRTRRPHSVHDLLVKTHPADREKIDADASACQRTPRHRPRPVDRFADPGSRVRRGSQACRTLAKSVSSGFAFATPGRLPSLVGTPEVRSAGSRSGAPKET